MSLRPMDDRQICLAVRSGTAISDVTALIRAGERGLVDLQPILTKKGFQLLDGIEATACSGWHMGGMPPVGDWREARKR